MLVTNGDKIVEFPQRSVEELAETAKDLKARAKDVLGIPKAKFDVLADPFPHIINSSGIAYAELKEMCTPDLEIRFMAIGDERVQMPQTVFKDIKHVFSPEEKTAIADNWANMQGELEALDIEAKHSAAGFKKRIGAIETKISELASKHRQGYEIKATECHLHLDFVNKARVYTDKDSSEVLHSEEMVPADKQLHIDFSAAGAMEMPDGPDPFDEDHGNNGASSNENSGE